MNIRNLAILGILSVALAGCGAKVATQSETQLETQEVPASPTPQGEDMMQSPKATATPVDVSSDASLKSAAKLKSSDDASSLKSDLDSTTVVNEDFK